MCQTLDTITFYVLSEHQRSPKNASKIIFNAREVLWFSDSAQPDICFHNEYPCLASFHVLIAVIIFRFHFYLSVFICERNYLCNYLVVSLKLYTWSPKFSSKTFCRLRFYRKSNTCNMEVMGVLFGKK